MMYIKKKGPNYVVLVNLHESHITAYRISFEIVEWTPLARRCPALTLVVTQKQALGSVKV
jgi:hypothetical protein